MRRSFFAVPALAAMSVLPAKAEMFGPGFQPCGEKTSTLEVVECVQAKTNASDQRLNAAYKALQAAGRRQSASTAIGGATAVGSIPGRQLRILRNGRWINPASAGSRMHTVDDGRPRARTRKGDEARLGGSSMRLIKRSSVSLVFRSTVAWASLRYAFSFHAEIHRNGRL